MIMLFVYNTIWMELSAYIAMTVPDYQIVLPKSKSFCEVYGDGLYIVLAHCKRDNVIPGL